MGTPGYFLIFPCYVTSEFGLDIDIATCQDITMACNESSDCSTATDLLNFVRSIITVSKLCLHSTHLRFSKPSSWVNVNISNRALILDASLSWLAFFTKQCYSMEAISHRGSTKAAHRCHFR